MDLLKFK